MIKLIWLLKNGCHNRIHLFDFIHNYRVEKAVGKIHQTPISCSPIISTMNQAANRIYWRSHAENPIYYTYFTYTFHQNESKLINNLHNMPVLITVKFVATGKHECVLSLICNQKNCLNKSHKQKTKIASVSVNLVGGGCDLFNIFILYQWPKKCFGRIASVAFIYVTQQPAHSIESNSIISILSYSRPKRK